MTDETSEDSKVVYCGTCHLIKGIGCACGLTFAEKIKGVGTSVPPHMRAVPHGPS